MIECPNHKGAYDCTPFCSVCAGEQEIPAHASEPATPSPNTNNHRLERTAG